jgi:hypothetical protein
MVDGTQTNPTIHRLFDGKASSGSMSDDALSELRWLAAAPNWVPSPSERRLKLIAAFRSGRHDDFLCNDCVLYYCRMLPFPRTADCIAHHSALLAYLKPHEAIKLYSMRRHEGLTWAELADLLETDPLLVED